MYIVLISIKGHSNNTWHFFWHFSDNRPPPPSVWHFTFLMSVFKTCKLGNMKWTRQKPNFAFKQDFSLSNNIINSVSRSKTSLFDILSTSPLKCHVLFEWPRLRSCGWMPWKKENSNPIQFISFIRTRNQYKTYKTFKVGLWQFPQQIKKNCNLFD